MTKQRVCIDFCDFSPHFPKTDNFYYHLLKDRYDLRLCDQPDFLFFGPYGQEHRLHSGVRILLSIEPVRPDYDFCDYSLTCLKVDDARHLQVPAYVPRCGAPEQLIKKSDDPERILAGKSKFCSFVVSNPDPPSRTEFFKKLNKYKRVDSGGRVLNNIGGPIPGAHARARRLFCALTSSTLPSKTARCPGTPPKRFLNP